MVKFDSSTLMREVDLGEVNALPKEQLTEFHAELRSVVDALTDALNGAKEKARLSGVPLDETWKHRVMTKRRIALKFATEANACLQGGSSVMQRLEYDRIYKARFRAMLVEEFGEAELQEIEQEILDASRKQYDAWLAATQQHKWFIP